MAQKISPRLHPTKTNAEALCDFLCGCACEETRSGMQAWRVQHLGHIADRAYAAMAPNLLAKPLHDFAVEFRRRLQVEAEQCAASEEMCRAISASAAQKMARRSQIALMHGLLLDLASGDADFDSAKARAQKILEQMDITEA